MRKALGLYSDPGGKLNLRFSQKPFLGSFLLIFLLMALSFSFLTPYFFANDDVFALMTAKGVGLALRPDGHVFLQNALLGIFLKALYGRFPGIPWYPWLEIAGLFLAFSSFLAGALLKSANRLTAFFFLLYFIMGGLFYCTQLDFSMLSCLLFQGGLFLWLALWDKKKAPWENRALSFGALCFWASALFRPQAFFYSLVLALPLIGLTLRDLTPQPKVFRAAAGIFLLILGSLLFDHFYYETDPAWKSYLSFQPVMYKCLNFQHWDYSAASKPVFDGVGWSENDLRLFNRWYFLDADTYSAGKMEKISAFFGTVKPPSPSSWLEVFSASTSQVLYTLQNLLLCFIVFLGFNPGPQRRTALITLFWVLLWLALLACLAKAPERIYLPAFTFLAGLALYQAAPGEKPLPSRGAKKKPLRWKLGWGLLAFLALLAVPSLGRYFSVDSHFRERAKLLTAVVEGLHPQDDQLYVIWNSRFPYEKLPALGSFEDFRTFHILSLAGLQRMPLTQALLDHFGVKNPLRDMVDNPRVFMICSDEEGELSRQYLREKFGMETKLEEVFFSPFFNVDRLRFAVPPGRENR